MKQLVFVFCLVALLNAASVVIDSPKPTTTTTTTTPTTTTATTTATTITGTAAPTPTTTSACPDDKEWNLDLTIYIDGQIYINSHFEDQVKFVKDFVLNYEIGKTKIGVFQFGRKSGGLFSASGTDFRSAKKMEDILRVLDNLIKYKYEPGEVQAFYMLKNAVDYNFSPAHGGRADAKHVVMILTGGKSKSPKTTKLLAEQLHNKSEIKTIVVEVGDDISKSVIKEIAGGKNGKKNTFKMKDPKAGKKIVKLLKSWTSC